MATTLLETVTEFLAREQNATQKSLLNFQRRLLQRNAASLFSSQAEDLEDMRELGELDSAEFQAQFESLMEQFSFSSELASSIEERSKSSALIAIDFALVGFAAGFSFLRRDPRLMSLLEERSQEQAALIGQVTAERMRQLYQRAVLEGWDTETFIDEAVDRLKKYAQPENSRSVLVGYFETVAAFEIAQQFIADEMMEAGIGMEKHWFDVGDVKVHPGCRTNTSAGWISAGDIFPSGASIPPDHGFCRCSASFRRSSG